MGWLNRLLRLDYRFRRWKRDSPKVTDLWEFDGLLFVSSDDGKTRYSDDNGKTWRRVKESKSP